MCRAAGGCGRRWHGRTGRARCVVGGLRPDATLALIIQTLALIPVLTLSPHPINPVLTLSQAYAQTPPRVLQYVALF